MKKILSLIGSGGIKTYAVFLLISLIIGLFVQGTVLCRGTERMFQEEKVIMPWIENGYFKLGGMRWSEGVVKKTYPWFYLFPAFLLEKGHYLLFGTFSYDLLAKHNQIISGIGAASIGFFAFWAAMLVRARRFESLLFGFSALAVYQTFPWNIASFFRVYPTHLWMVFAPLLMTCIMRELKSKREKSKMNCVGESVLAFTLFYTEYIASSLLVFSILVLSFFLVKKNMDLVRLIKPLIMAGAFAMGIFILSLIYISKAYPDVKWSGSTFLYRSGLDGDFQYYFTNNALLSRSCYTPLYLQFSKNIELLSRWKLIFCLGIAGFAACFLKLALTKVQSQQNGLAAVLVCVGAMIMQYTIFGAIFTQAAITHPFGYDIYLAGPLIICGFAILPSIVGETLHRNRAWPLVFLLIALYVSMSQLRLFALVFPK